MIAPQKKSVHYKKIHFRNCPSNRLQTDNVCRHQANRITSYNVCYTKLLRLTQEVKILNLSDISQEIADFVITSYSIHYTKLYDENFSISAEPLHPHLFRAVGLVKQAAVEVNHELGYIAGDIFAPIYQACSELAAGGFDHLNTIPALQGVNNLKTITAYRLAVNRCVITSYSIHYTKLYDENFLKGNIKWNSQ